MAYHTAPANGSRTGRFYRSHLRACLGIAAVLVHGATRPDLRAATATRNHPTGPSRGRGAVAAMRAGSLNAGHGGPAARPKAGPSVTSGRAAPGAVAAARSAAAHSAAAPVAAVPA